jgi:hypothetical protein
LVGVPRSEAQEVQREIEIMKEQQVIEDILRKEVHQDLFNSGLTDYCRKRRGRGSKPKEGLLRKKHEEESGRFLSIV